jgi:hypothetical protein
MKSTLVRFPFEDVVVLTMINYLEKRLILSTSLHQNINWLSMWQNGSD